MTFVTTTTNSRQTRGWKVSKELFGRWQFGFQSLQIVNDHGAPVDLYQSFGLEAGEIPGNQLAHRPDLRRQFLVADRQSDLYSVRRALAFGSGKTQ